MNKVVDFLKDLHRDGTKPEPQLVDPQMERALTWSLNKLVSYGLLNDPEAMDDWKQDLADLDVQAIYQGTYKARDHRGYLTLGEFRAMCAKVVLDPSHKAYTALVQKGMEPAELQKRIAKMRQETGL